MGATNERNDESQITRALKDAAKTIGSEIEGIAHELEIRAAGPRLLSAIKRTLNHWNGRDAGAQWYADLLAEVRAIEPDWKPGDQ